MVAEAKAGASIFILVRGGTREVTLDKRLGDCGMTCSAAKHGETHGPADPCTDGRPYHPTKPLT